MDQPATVFGSSFGAIVALEVLSHTPEQAQTVVAHEPPAVALLPDAAKWLAFQKSAPAPNSSAVPTNPAVPNNLNGLQLCDGEWVWSRLKNCGSPNNGMQPGYPNGD